MERDRWVKEWEQVRDRAEEEGWVEVVVRERGPVGIVCAPAVGKSLLINPELPVPR